MAQADEEKRRSKMEALARRREEIASKLPVEPSATSGKDVEPSGAAGGSDERRERLRALIQQRRANEVVLKATKR